MKPKHILFGLFALIAASCTNDDLNEVTDMKQNGIQVTAGLSANTRVSFEQDGVVTHALWEEGDQITLYAPSQGYLPYQVSSLSEDATSATFTPINDALQNTNEIIYAAHRAGMEADIVDGIAILPYTDTWTDEHPLPFAYAIGKVADGKLNLSFEHIFAYLKLTLNAETVADSDVKEIAHLNLTNSSGTPISIAAGRFDFSTQSIIEDKGINEINLSLLEPFTATGTAEKSVYIPILPQQAGETITINIFSDYEANDILFTETKEVPSTGFVAGHAYTYSPKSSITRVENTITLTEAGTLSQAINAAEKDTITSLKIIGPLNGDDIRFIIEMAGRDINEKVTKGKLDHLDISEASIVEGGGMYFVDYDGNQHYTSNDVIGDCMFWRCCLKTLILPNNVTSIGDFAFYDSSSLSSITIPDGVTSIGKEAFLNCIALSSIVIPDALATIGNSAFSVCTALTSIVIPDGVTSIGEKAFFSCEALTSVNIPDAVTSIGKSAFIGCEGLASVNISDLSAWCKIEFGDVSANPLSSCATAKLYLNGKELTDVIIPNNITQIKNFTFGGYDALTSITIPTGVTLIGDGAFNGCSSLSTITIPEGVTTIGDSAFQNCTSLSDIVIPNSVINIKDFAFYSCSSLADVTCNALTPPILGGLSFESIASPSTLIVPADCATAYSESDWAQYFTTIEEATR